MSWQIPTTQESYECKGSYLRDRTETEGAAYWKFTIYLPFVPYPGLTLAGISLRHPDQVFLIKSVTWFHKSIGYGFFKLEEQRPQKKTPGRKSAKNNGKAG